MPRGKRGATPGDKSHGGSKGRRGTPSSLETSFIPFAGTSAPRGANRGLSLQEEARNTERHAFWDSDQKLRHSKVNFVSAAKVDSLPEVNKHPEAAMAQMTLDSPPREELEIEVVVEEDIEDSNQNSDVFPANASTSISSFVIDTLGGQPVQTGLSPPRLRSISPSSSNSSEEVILFSGRNNRGKLENYKSAETPVESIDAKIKIVEEKIHEREQLLSEVIPPTESVDYESLLPKQRGRAHRRDRFSRKTREQEEEDALIADYLQNIDDDDDLTANLSFNQRELGGEEELWEDEAQASSRENLQIPKHRNHDGWDRSDILDFDDMSTSDGVMGEIQAILSKRERDNGLQYLVVWEDQTVDEARWVPASTLSSPNAVLHIEGFEAEERLVAEFQGIEEDDSMDSEDTDDEEDGNDEEDLLQRRDDRMADEQIARLLAKQEELGMDANQLLLFDGTADADDDEANPSLKNTYNPFMLSATRARPKAQASKRRRGEFPAATALADAYDGFDVMDFERPSLKKKPKGCKGKLVFDLSDSELEASMQMAWDNDRVKKKERKQEREELRAQGLLGNKNGKPDLKEKYKGGMGFHSIKEEIKTFLMSNHTTLSLPPMDKADRKVVHEIANAFNLKSKSAGSGSTRFPILYRTSRTSAYVERTFAAVEARLTRRFLPRMDVGSKRSTPKRSGRAIGGGGFNNAAVSYRDGDIVGGSAPELGVDNKGRAMLEKMGWSTGTALGALNNKGILQPVSHIVKTTKAGLG